MSPKIDNGLQSFFISLDLHGRASKDQNLHLKIHSFDAPFTSPTLAPTSVNFTIPGNQFSKSGGDTIVQVVCTVELMSRDSLAEKEKAFIVKEGEEDNPFILIIRSLVPSKRAVKTNASVEPTAKPADLVGNNKSDSAKSGVVVLKANVPPKVGDTGKAGDPVSPAGGEPDPDTSRPAETAKKNTVTLVGADTSFNPLITSDIITRTYTVKLHFHSNGTPGKDTIKVALELGPGNAAKIAPVLETQMVTIQPEDWNHRDSQDNIIKVARFKMNSVATFEHEVSFFIRQKGDPDNSAEIRINTIGLYNPNKPFWVEVGANFDFSDGLKPNNFFGGVFLHKRDIRPIFSGKKKGQDKPKRLGLFAGVYESKTVSDISTEDFSIQKYYNDRSTLLTRNDSVGAFADTGKIKTTQVVKNIGLFFSPQVRLTNGSANADGLHVAASAWLELQWQTISSKTDYSAMARRDTFYVPPSTLDTTVRRLKFGSEQDIRSHYLGFGLPIFYKEGDANVFFNPVIGLSNQPSSKDLLTFSDQTKRRWRPFYIFQFRLNEERFGMAFTGEVRGLIIHNSKPLVSLALTKKFDLSKFLEFK